MAIEDAEGCIRAIRDFGSECALMDLSVARGEWEKAMKKSIHVFNQWEDIVASCELSLNESDERGMDYRFSELGKAIEKRERGDYLLNTTLFNNEVERMIELKLVPLLRPL